MAESPWGGSEELWYSLANLALEDGHRVAISIYKWPELQPKIQNLIQKGAVVNKRNRISYKKILGKVKGKFVQQFIAKVELEKFLEKQSPDLVVFSMGAFCDFEIDSLRSVLINCDIPYVVLIHSNNDKYKIAPNKVKSIIEVCKKAKFLGFVSKRIQLLSEKQLLYSFENARIIVNPVNISEFGVMDLPSLDLIRFASVGTLLLPVKGQDLLIKILSVEKWKKRSWVLDLYGKGPDEEKIKELILKYGLSDKVFLKGYVDDVRNSIWKNHHLLLLPSYIEGMPIALVEAMLCGRTALVTDVGGNRELIGESDCIYMSESVSVEGISNALDVLWDEMELWKKKGEQAFALASKYYGSDPLRELLNNILTIADYK